MFEVMWGQSTFTPTGNLQDFDRTDVLGRLEIPVLFTTGRYDEARPETVERFARTVANAEVTIFENSAHMPMFSEPEVHLEVIRDFVRRAERF